MNEDRFVLRYDGERRKKHYIYIYDTEKRIKHTEKSALIDLLNMVNEINNKLKE
jgi:hypothetical protein